MDSKLDKQQGVKEQGKDAKGEKREEKGLRYTSLGEIEPGVEKLRKSYMKSHKTHSVQFRLNQLRNLYFAIKDNAETLCDALYEDFHRARSETRNLEVTPALNELVFIMANLHRWVKPKRAEGLPTAQIGVPVTVEHVPLGVVLVITPFNYPLFISVSSIIGALAAGNVVVYKPSELTPKFSSVFSTLVAEALDKDIFFAIQGGIPETTKLLDQKFDKIMYTGSTFVGKIIAKKAAETLTPVLLEMGGKSPAIVLDDLKDSEMKAAAQRIVWGSFVNAGQTCVASDYVLVPKPMKEKFVKLLIEASKRYFPGDEKEYDFTHMINDKAVERMTKMINDTSGDIVVGGDIDKDTRYVSPTIVDNCTWDDATMTSEIFGPILPVIAYETLEDAVSNIVALHDTPLAQYIFTSGKTDRSNPKIDFILTNVRSGDVSVNELIMHVGLPSCPFGGVGESGQGSYHGYYSFDAFSHQRILMCSPLNNESMLASRYPPYCDKKDKIITRYLSPYNQKVWFDKKSDVRINGPYYAWAAYTTVAGLFNLAVAFVTGGNS